MEYLKYFGKWFLIFLACFGFGIGIGELAIKVPIWVVGLIVALVLAAGITYSKRHFELKKKQLDLEMEERKEKKEE